VFVGHFAVGLAGKRLVPTISLATWFLAVQFLDLLWPVCLLTGVEHVRIVPGITRFTPLDFYDYPVTHSLVGAAVWGLLVAGGYLVITRRRRGVGLLFVGVLSHWLLDVATHRPDVPLLPHGPYLGLGLWNSIPATLAVETAMFGGGIALYVSVRKARASFWALIIVLFALYLGAASTPPPSVTVLAWSALTGWLLLPWAWWADRDEHTR
jgi:membrane-bound metal-dependent hydrolase YbcI (DUF457 family)